MAQHVMNVHLNANTVTEPAEGELDLAFFKKYINYCRMYGLSNLVICRYLVFSQNYIYITLHLII